MEPTGKKENLDTQNPVALQEFCDMDQLYQLLSNWSDSTGMAAVIVDNEGRHTSDTFGITEFCSMVHGVKAGAERCFATWRNECDGIYVCHMS